MPSRRRLPEAARRPVARGAGPGRGRWPQRDGRGPAPAGRGAGRRGRGQPRHGPLRAGRHPPVASSRPTSPRPRWPSTPWRAVVDGVERPARRGRADAARRLGQLRMAFVQLQRVEAAAPAPEPTAGRRSRPAAASTASQRPRRPATTSKLTGGADRDGAGAVGDRGAVEEQLDAVGRPRPCRARASSKARPDRHRAPGHVSGRSWRSAARGCRWRRRP